MPITGKFEADFSSFVAAVNTAQVSLQGFEADSAKLGKTLGQMADQFSGRKIIEQGAELARLFQTTDDLALLTKSELQQVGVAAAAAADKMERLGLAVPAGLQNLVDTTKEATKETQGLHQAYGAFDSVLSAAGINIGKEVKALSEVSTALSGTTQNLGLFATAGLAVGTAMAAFNLTRMLEQIAGVDKTLDNFFAKWGSKIMGFGDTEAAAAGARADVLAKASQTAGRAITDLSEAMRINEESSRKHMLAVDTSAGRIKNWHDEIAAVQARGEFKQFTTDLESGAFELDELAKRYNLTGGALHQYQQDQQDADEAAKNAAASTKQLSDDQVKAAAAYGKALADQAKFMEDFAIKTHGIAMKEQEEVEKAQAKSLAAMNKTVLEGFTQIQKLTAENTDYVMKQTLSETDYKLKKIDEWERATIAAFKGTDEELARYTEQVKIRAQQQRDALVGATQDIVTLIGKSAAEAEAERQKAAKQTGDVVTDEYRRQQEAFMSFKGIVVAGTGEMVGASEALVNSMTRVIDNAGDWLERQFQMQQAQRDRGEFFNPGMGGGMPTGHRASGGPVMAGGTYVVGEQGPELFRPSASGMIVPNGGGAPVVNATFYINGSVKDLAQPLMNELTRLMKQTRQWPTA